MKKFILIFFLAGTSVAHATTFISDGSSVGGPNSVQSLHDAPACQDGDTIIIPAGSFNWTTGLVITKAITLQGAGAQAGGTVIKDAVQNNKLIMWTLPPNAVSRLTGIDFQDGGRTTTAVPPDGIIHVDGHNTDGSQFRWDHCGWHSMNGYPVFDTVIGVADHNDASYGAAGKANGWWEFEGTRWNDQDNGDGSWAAPANYGSSQFFFVEDNTSTNLGSGQAGYTDGALGCRFVIRHNTIPDSVIGNHGTESTGRPRGGRCMEVYNNTFIGRGSNKYIGGVRSGGVLVHDNTIQGYGGWNGLLEWSLTCMRMVHSFAAWNGADGTNVWDVNTPSGGPFTVTAVNGATVTVSGNPWSANQWAFLATVHRNQGGFSIISANTSNTITCLGDTFGGGNIGWSVGDTFNIYTITQALDGPCRGGGSLISGNPPVPPAGWNNQVTEPCYSWNNTNENGLVANLFKTNEFYVSKENQHYFQNSQMPEYTPYTYPHPLTGASPAPTPSPTPTSTP